MPRDISNESEELKDWLKPVTALAESRGDHLPAPVDPVGGLLIRARKLIEREEDWFCGSPNAGHINAGRSCIHLAIMHANGMRRLKDETLRVVANAIEPIEDAHVTSVLCRIWHFNDTSKHADVLALFDRAIASRKVAALVLPAEGRTSNPLIHKGE